MTEKPAEHSRVKGGLTKRVYITSQQQAKLKELAARLDCSPHAALDHACTLANNVLKWAQEAQEA